MVVRRGDGVGATGLKAERKGGKIILPVPRQQLVELADGVFGQTGKDIAQPGLGIDIVQLGRWR